jgi:hypothetical protein
VIPTASYIHNNSRSGKYSVEYRHQSPASSTIPSPTIALYFLRIYGSFVRVRYSTFPRLRILTSLRGLRCLTSPGEPVIVLGSATLSPTFRSSFLYDQSTAVDTKTDHIRPSYLKYKATCHSHVRKRVGTPKEPGDTGTSTGITYIQQHIPKKV